MQCRTSSYEQKTKRRTKENLKMKDIIKRLKQWKEGKKAPPYGIELAPTLRCNINCLFCWREESHVDYSDELTLKEYKRIIEEASELGVKEIKIIGGGDALCKEGIINLMSLIKDKGMFGYICTNGILFSEKDIKILAEKQWDHIKLSFHGPDEKTNDAITRKKGSFQKVVQNIKIINKYKKNKPILEFGIVLINKNYNKIKEMIELAKELNVKNVFIEPITVYSKLGESLKLNAKQKEEFKGIAKSAHEIAKKYGIETNLQHFYDSEFLDYTNKMDQLIPKEKTQGFANAACFEPFYRIGIRVNGKVGPCGFLDSQSPENIKEKSLKEIWYGSYFEELRKKMINKQLLPQCKKCCTTLIINNQEIRKRL